MNKKKVSLLLNILIVILEIIGLIINYKTMNRISIEYYTIDSNILALCSSLILIIYLLTNKKIPRWLSLFKYISVIGLSVTLLVVLFILIPMGNFDYYTYLISNSMLYQHTLCPIIGIVTFLFFDNLGKYYKKDILIGLIFTIIYSIVLIILNVLNIVNGPYPFLMVRTQSILSSIIWFVVIYLLAFIISHSLRVLYLKQNK